MLGTRGYDRPPDIGHGVGAVPSNRGPDVYFGGFGLSCADQFGARFRHFRNGTTYFRHVCKIDASVVSITNNSISKGLWKHPHAYHDVVNTYSATGLVYRQV